ncbi:ATP-binding protein [Helicobacter sp. 16-1353]|uniref:ATP-binding protein n=1 Tax=Helicobacter sp. 16-1353 TaxID=2004996 RepID=UPI0015EE5FB6|nr:ATP-binding protein [Helicobacter sp. 16-1353]
MRNKRKEITNQEISIIKRLIDMKIPNQEILGHINKSRGDVCNHINNGRITDIKKGKIGNNVKMATQEEANHFINIDSIENLLIHKDGYLLGRESETLEYKESFGGIKDSRLLQTIQGMANNKGGYIVFGIKESNDANISKRYKIKGIDEKEQNDLMGDNKKISEKLQSNFGEEVKYKKECKTINNKTIGYLKIEEAENKPIINTQGDIYYRYDAETKKMAKGDLVRILNEYQGKILKPILYKFINTILENGIENSAILNIATGSIKGKSGSFLIDKELLPKISFIKEGNFVEKNGAPVFVLKGDVRTAEVVRVNIKEADIYNIFFNKEDIDANEAKRCLEVIAESQCKWIPMRYFIKKANMDKEQTIEMLKKIKTTKKSYVKNHIEVLNNDEPVALSDTNIFIGKIKKKQNFEYLIKKDADINKITKAIMSLEVKDFDSKYMLKQLLWLHRKYSSSKYVTNIRKAIAYVDKSLFE